MRAVEILKRWHQWGVVVLSLEPHHSPSILKKASYRVHTSKILTGQRTLLTSCCNFFILLLNFVYKGIKFKDDFDIIIASNSNFSDVLPAWILSKLLRKPFVVVFQSMAYSTTFRKTYLIIKEQNINRSSLALFALACTAAVMLRLARSAACILCSSQALKNMLFRIGFKESKIFVTAAGVDIEYFTKVKVDRKKYDAVFLGRIEINKGIKDLLTAWKRVSSSIPNASLLLIGSGSYSKEAQRYAQELNIDEQVTFMGPIFSSEKIRYLKMSQLFVFPSYTEGWSLSVVEGMASMLPVIGYDIPFFREIASECKGVSIVPKFDCNRLADCILGFLNDEAKLKASGERSFDFAKRYDWNLIAERELKHVKSIVCEENQV